MGSLEKVKSGQTVTVVKIDGVGATEASNNGYGHHEGMLGVRAQRSHRLVILLR